MNRFRSSLISFFLFLFIPADASSQWIQTNGPFGGDVQALVATWTGSETDLFAGTSGGIFRSTDAGITWMASDAGIIDRDIGLLAADGTTLLAAGTYDVYLSINAGTSWSRANFNITGALLPITALGIGTSTLIASHEYGTYYSTDGGASWTISDIPYGVSSIARMGPYLFASSGSGVLRSTNGGINWIPTSLTNPSVVALTVSGSSLYAGAAVANGVFRSQDSGATWVQLDTTAMLSGLHAIAVIDEDLFAGSQYGDGVYFLNGSAWEQRINGLSNMVIGSMAVSDSVLIAGTMGGGIFSSSDRGANWIQSNQGLKNAYTKALGVDPGIPGRVLAGTTSGGAFASSDGGTSWQGISSGLTNLDVRTFLANGSTHYAGTYGGGVFRSTDGGASWTVSNAGLTNNHVQALTLFGSHLFAATGTSATGGVFRSTDAGVTWTTAGTGLPNRPFHALGVCGSTVFAGCGGTTSGSGIYASYDDGMTWAKIDSGFPANKRVYAITVGGANVFAGTSDDIYISSDSGKSWTQAVSNPAKDIFALAIDGARAFAGARSSSQGIGVLLSTDGGAEWTEVNLGLRDKDVISLLADGSTLYAGTKNGGVWKRPLSEFAVYTISASAESHGTIKPSGEQRIESEGTIAFLIRPAEGYVVDSVVVDGVMIGSPGTYTFTGVTSNREIRATFRPGASVRTVKLNTGWNLVSVPLSVIDNSTSAIYPAAISPLYFYEAGAYFVGTALNRGTGYWLKFDSPQSVTVIGAERADFSAAVAEGWNLIGAPPGAISPSSFETDLPTLLTSQFFGYDGAYRIADTLRPGQGYWVKVNQDGELRYTFSQDAHPNRIRIIAGSDMPPPPPDPLVEKRLPGEFALEQNYPNPFNPSTVISYDLPQDAHVHIVILNILGQKVATLVDGEEEAGSKRVTWNALSVPSGVYFCRIEAMLRRRTGVSKSFVKVNKLVLVR